MRTPLTVLASLVHLGEGLAQDVTERRKVLYLNALVMVAIFTYGVYFVFYYSLAADFQAFQNAAIVLAVQGALFIAILLLNHFGLFRLARWAFSINVMSSVIMVMITGQGHYLNLHFYFLMFSGLPLIYSTSRQMSDILILFTLNIALFVLAAIGAFPPSPELYALKTTITNTMRILNIVVSSTILALILYLSEHAIQKSEASLEHLSTIDSLTGLLNRHGLLGRFEDERARCKRNGTYGVLAFFDLDDFKPLNDTYGHAAGDQLLQQVSKRIADSLRDTDVVSRFGGDEFITLICSDDVSEAEAMRHAHIVIEKIETALSLPYDIHGDADTPGDLISYRSSASIGLAPFHGQSQVENVINTADHAMYAIKSDHHKQRE